jgi:hypothetical protein
MSRIPKAYLETLRRLVELWPESAAHRAQELMKGPSAKAQPHNTEAIARDETHKKASKQVNNSK